MKVVVMAGGSGSRLRPLTIQRPKPMMPVVNRTVLGHILNLLKINDFTDIIITVQYLADAIQDYFRDGSSLGLKLHYSIEEMPLGTAGSVKNAAQFLDDTFLVISGDAITDFDLQDIVRFHKERGAKATLTLYRVPDPLEYGVIIVDEEGRILQFLEKPGWGQVMSDTVNTGLYVLEPEVLSLFEENEPFDFSRQLFPLMLERKYPLYGYVAEGYWCDIGNIQEYMRATADMLEGKVRHVDLGLNIGGEVWVGQDVEIAPDARLHGPVYLGDSVKVKGGVVIHGPTVIRDYTIVDNRAHIERSVIWRNSYVGESVETRGAIIARRCVIKPNAVIFEGGVIGDETIIGEGAIVHPNVKIWPSKEVVPGATVKNSIIWGSQGRKVLFNRFGVSGAVNVDLTPEFAARLGAAFGSTLPLGSNVTINRDPHRSPRMLKRAIISGLPSAGINVWDLRTQPIPVARYYTSVTDAVAGIHLRLSPYDQRVVDIKFIGPEGMNLDREQERGIEHIFFREDFRRVYLDEIGTINYASRVKERYIEGFLDAIDTEAIRRAGFYIVVDYASATTSEVLPAIFNRLNCNVVAINASVEEAKMSILSDDFRAELEQLGVIASALQVNLAMRLDVGGEQVFLVDDGGTLLGGEIACAALAELAMRVHPGKTIAVPVNMPNMFEQIAQRHGGRVIRTKTTPHDLMKVARENRDEIVLAGDGNGNFVFPSFHCTIDGMMAGLKLLEFLACQNTTLTEVISGLPPFHITRKRVKCPWEVKGKIMRLMNQRCHDRETQNVDGLKIMLHEGEWILVLPDPDFPYMHVYAEAASDLQAESLAVKYSQIVENLQYE